MALPTSGRQLAQLDDQKSYSRSRDGLQHYLWDSRPFGSTPTDYTFFNQPIGASWTINSTVGSKQKNETNMVDTGKVPTGQNFLVTRIGVGLISSYDPQTTGATSGYANAAMIYQAFVNILQTSVFELTLAGKAFDFQVHGRQFLPAIALSGYNATGLGNVSRNGDHVVSGWLSIKENSPINLNSQVSFSFQQYCSQVGNSLQTTIQTHSFAYLNAYNCTMMVTLEGFLTRSK